MEKSVTRSFYEITFDKENFRPTSLKMVVLAAVKGEKIDPKLEKGEHVAFTFDYSFSSYGEIAKLDVPADARKILK